VQRVPMLKVGVVFLSLNAKKKKKGEGGTLLFNHVRGGLWER
jgi:hypothetical protein